MNKLFFDEKRNIEIIVKPYNSFTHTRSEFRLRQTTICIKRT